MPLWEASTEWLLVDSDKNKTRNLFSSTVITLLLCSEWERDLQEVANGVSNTAASVGSDLGLWTAGCQQTHNCLYLALHHLQLTTGLCLPDTPLRFNISLPTGSVFLHFPCHQKWKGKTWWMNNGFICPVLQMWSSITRCLPGEKDKRGRSVGLTPLINRLIVPGNNRGRPAPSPSQRVGAS